MTRRGLVLSAAFLLTALSRGRVFAERVPAELVKNTVLLAGKFGARGPGLALFSGESEAAAGSSVPAQVALLSKSALRARRAWWSAKSLLILILALTASVGACLAATAPDRISGLGSALSSMLPVRFGGSAPCHADRDR